jgi:hypothetical protein
MKKILFIFADIQETLVNILISLAYFRTKFRLRVSKSLLRGRSVAIVANGPTLRSDLERMQRSVKVDEYICVNHLADTDLFTQLRPKMYVFSDPYFYSKDASNELVAARMATFENINSKCDWPMIIVMPNGSSVESFAEKFERNPHLQVCWFNGTGFPANYNALLGKLWDFGLCAPPGNVLVQSLYLCGFMRTNEVFLLGANWSFHTNIEVDQRTNEFYKVRNHVYGTRKELSFTCHRKIERANLEHEFRSLYVGFKELRASWDYLSARKVKVVNFTENSFIDVFPRPVDF